MGDDPQQVGKAFDAANIGYRYDEARAYFSEPVAPGAAPGPAAIVHTSSPYLMFEQGGFSGVLRFDEHDRMSEISFEGEKPMHRRGDDDGERHGRRAARHSRLDSRVELVSASLDLEDDHRLLGVPVGIDGDIAGDTRE